MNTGDSDEQRRMILVAPALAVSAGRGRHGAAAWRDWALCAEVDPELFFPETGELADPAKRVCQACEVRAECLRYALDPPRALRCMGRPACGERLDLARQLRPGITPRRCRRRGAE
jgi:hypothetical protein